MMTWFIAKLDYINIGLIILTLNYVYYLCFLLVVSTNHFHMHADWIWQNTPYRMLRWIGLDWTIQYQITPCGCI